MTSEKTSKAKKSKAKKKQVKKPATLRAPWKPGESGNPSGRPKTSEELKVIKNLTEKELIEIGNLVIKGNVAALRAVKEDPDASVIKTMIAGVCVKVISKGDMQALDVLLNRLIGKVKDKVDLGGALNVANAVQVVVSLPSNGREVAS